MELTVQIRSDTGKKAARAHRAAGRTPAVLYGHGEKPVHLLVDHKEMVRLIRKHRETGLVQLIVIDGDQTQRQQAIYKNVTTSTLKRQLQHVDFQAVRAGEKVNVKVAVKLRGLPVGVEKEGGVLAQVISELDVRVEADKIPEEIVVDVGHLELGHAVRLREIDLAGLEVHHDMESIVATVTHAAREALPVAAEAVPAEGEVAEAEGAEAPPKGEAAPAKGAPAKGAPAKAAPAKAEKAPAEKAPAKEPKGKK